MVHKQLRDNLELPCDELLLVELKPLEVFVADHEGLSFHNFFNDILVISAKQVVPLCYLAVEVGDAVDLLQLATAGLVLVLESLLNVGEHLITR